MSPSRAATDGHLRSVLRVLHGLSAEEQRGALEVASSVVGNYAVEDLWSHTGVPPTNPAEATQQGLLIAKEIEGGAIPPAVALTVATSSGQSNYEKRRLGTYYTDFRLAEYLAEQLRVSTTTAIVDSASGTGTLLVAAVRAGARGDKRASARMVAEYVSAADLDNNSLAIARLALLAECGDIGVLETLDARLRAVDSLRAGPSLWKDVAPHGFDISIGNPPWERTKLSRHEFVHSLGYDRHYGREYGAELDEEAFRIASRRDQVKASDLLSNYKLQGSGEADLYKLFTELALMVTRDEGQVGLLVPAGLIRSLGTNALRKAVIDKSSRVHFCVFDNRARFFAIDTRFKFVSLIADLGREPCEVMLSHGTATSSEACSSPPGRLDATELTDASGHVLVPEVRDPAESDLFGRLTRAGAGAGQQTWQFKYFRELDMTNDRPKFKREKDVSRLPVVEGRMIAQHRFGAKEYLSGSGRAARWRPLSLGFSAVRPQFWIERDRIPPGAWPRVDNERVGFCDVTGQTNERTVIAAMVPAGAVAGNKVPTLIFHNADSRVAWSWLAIANSFVLDWYARRIITTSLNLFLLSRLPMPPISVFDDRLRRLAELARGLSKLDSSPGASAWEAAELRLNADVIVAEAFNIGLSEMQVILSDFLLLDRRQPALPGEDRSTITRDFILSRFGGEQAAERLSAARALGAVPYILEEYVGA